MDENKAVSFKEASTPPESPRPVAVVVVHGIGDQVANATVQQVVTQFSRHYNTREPVSLGAFDPGPFERIFTTHDGTERRFTFSEVYWADIPRKVVTDGYTLEETKRWASIIVERLKPADTTDGSKINYPLIKQVIREMVETIGVLERLTFLIEKAGIAKFDLNKVLVDYLDDVQLVAEFKGRRSEILKKFSDALARVDPRAEIYLVAHSEGTVVSFLGLLDAMWLAETPDWLKQVRGFLTIGSPIDKHLVLWPELFKWNTPPKFNPAAPRFESESDPRIQWRNYFDFGDPVGFELDYARKWLRHPSRGVTAFAFEGREDRKSQPGRNSAKDMGDDIGFARYFLPGKAHNDYWDDPDVFDHFIEDVVKKSKKPRQPQNRKGVWLVTYVASYGLPTLLLVAAVFFVLRSVTGFNAEASGFDAPGSFRLLGDAFGIGCLLAAMTVLARMPRLACPRRSLKWIWIALGVFAVLASAFWIATSDASAKSMAKLPEFAVQISGLIREPSILSLKAILVGIAAAIASFSAWAGRRYVVCEKYRWSCGSKPLLLLGGGTAIAMVLVLLHQEGSSRPSLWPVMLSLGGLLYAWWLATLLFDLIFVWHRYIRHGVANMRMEGICEKKTVAASEGIVDAAHAAT